MKMHLPILEELTLTRSSQTLCSKKHTTTQHYKHITFIKHTAYTHLPNSYQNYHMNCSKTLTNQWHKISCCKLFFYISELNFTRNPLGHSLTFLIQEFMIPNNESKITQPQHQILILRD